jgi:hypothetical protein
MRLALGVNDIHIWVNAIYASAASNCFSFVCRNTVLSNDDVIANLFSLFPNSFYTVAVAITHHLLWVRKQLLRETVN